MKRLALAMTVVATSAMGPLTASALALPGISITLSGTYPLRLATTLLSAKAQLSTATAVLKGEGVLLSLLTSEVTSAGTFEALVDHVENSEGMKCSSSGDKEGEVLTKGTFDVVYTSLSPATLGILYLPSEAMITCAAEKIRVRGSILSSVGSSEESSELTQLASLFHGNGSGKPTITTYYNNSGESIKAKLEANFGSGFEESADEIEPQVTPLASGNKMFVILQQPIGRLLPFGGELNFTGMARGAMKTLEVENHGPIPVTAYLYSQRIEEGGNRAAETNFKIVGGSCTVPGEELNVTERCSVIVEFVSGNAGVNAQYFILYGNRLLSGATLRMNVKS
jgi:hypothetical protein